MKNEGRETYPFITNKVKGGHIRKSKNKPTARFYERVCYAYSTSVAIPYDDLYNAAL